MNDIKVSNNFRALYLLPNLLIDESVKISDWPKEVATIKLETNNVNSIVLFIDYEISRCKLLLLTVCKVFKQVALYILHWQQVFRKNVKFNGCCKLKFLCLNRILVSRDWLTFCNYFTKKKAINIELYFTMSLQSITNLWAHAAFYYFSQKRIWQGTLSIVLYSNHMKSH